MQVISLIFMFTNYILVLSVFCLFQCFPLLTYFMVQSPSWAANWFAATQEIPRISWNPKVHYRTHKCPPPVSILGQSNPVHIPTSHLLEISLFKSLFSTLFACCAMLPLVTLPPGDPSAGVVYLRTVLSPEQASHKWVFLYRHSTTNTH